MKIEKDEKTGQYHITCNDEELYILDSMVGYVFDQLIGQGYDEKLLLQIKNDFRDAYEAFLK